MHRRALLGGLAAMGALVAGPRAEPLPPPTADLALLEPLYAINASRAGLTLRVASRGCTTKLDFSFYVDRQPTVPTIAFGRRRADVCKADPANYADLTFSYAELGLNPGAAVVVLNPIVATPDVRTSTRRPDGRRLSMTKKSGRSKKHVRLSRAR